MGVVALVGCGADSSDAPRPIAGPTVGTTGGGTTGSAWGSGSTGNGFSSTGGGTTGGGGFGSTGGTGGSTGDGGTSGIGGTSGGGTTGGGDLGGGGGEQFSATHIIEVRVPEDTTNSGCDANGDGVVNKADGEINALIALAKTLGQDFNEVIDTAVVAGEIVLLSELHGYKGVDGPVGVSMYTGVPADVGCSDYADDGTHCDWLIAPESYNASGDPVVHIPSANVVGGQLQAGPTDFNFSLPLGTTPLLVVMRGGQIKGQVKGGFDYVGGRLCGRIAKSDLQQGLDKACAVPEPGEICGLKDVIVGLLDCVDPELCSLVVELEGVTAKSLADAP